MLVGLGLCAKQRKQKRLLLSLSNHADGPKLAAGGAADDADFSSAVQCVVGESGFPDEPSSIAAHENPFSAWHKTRGYAAV